MEEGSGPNTYGSFGATGKIEKIIQSEGFLIANPPELFKLFPLEETSPMKAQTAGGTEAAAGSPGDVFKI